MQLKAVRRLSIASYVRGDHAITVVNSTSVTKNLADELFAPAKAIVGLLDAFGDLHPAVKVQSH